MACKVNLPVSCARADRDPHAGRRAVCKRPSAKRKNADTSVVNQTRWKVLCLGYSSVVKASDYMV